MTFSGSVQRSLLFFLLCISIGRAADDEASSTTGKILLPRDHYGAAQFAPLKNVYTGTIIGEITAKVVHDILVVELRLLEGGGVSMDRCVMTKEVHSRGAGKEEITDFVDSVKTNRRSFFFGTDMKLVREYCDERKMALETSLSQQWNDIYNINGQVFFQCSTRDDGLGIVQEDKAEINKISATSSLRATRSLQNNVNASETFPAHFEVGLACGISDHDSAKNEQGNAENQHSFCAEVDISSCPARTQDCVSDLLWDQRPSQYVPTEKDEGRERWEQNGRKIMRYKVAYGATGRAVGKPFNDDKHRALILTQPKVGTGAMFKAMFRVSDFVLRSHEVGILRPNSRWIPFPGCTAKPPNGECTVVLSFRDPKTWLDSAYFEFRSTMARGENASDSHGEIRAYHDFFRGAKKRARILDWWRIAEQLRLLGISSTSEFLKSVMDNGGVKILAPGDLPQAPQLISGCNVIVLQTEMAKYGTEVEREIQSILPKFRFQTPKEIVSRVGLNPELAAAYMAVKEAALPSDIMELMFQESPDFHEAWELYYASS